MFHMASLAGDMAVLQHAQAAAKAYLTSAPDPQDPRNQALLARVHQLFDAAGDTFN